MRPGPPVYGPFFGIPAPGGKDAYKKGAYKRVAERRMEDKTVDQLCAMAEEGHAYADFMFLSFETERLVHCA